MNLKNEIRKIVQLQKNDSCIYKLRQEKDMEKPSLLKKIKLEFEQKKEIISVDEKKIKELHLKNKEKEIDLGSKEESLKKIQGQLYQLKTNKEYQIKLNEIGSLKADISVAEENMLKILEEIESAKKDLELKKEILCREEKNFKEEECKIKNQIKDIEIKISGLENKRNSFTNEIGEKTLAKYEQLLKTRGGLAIVPVNGNHCGFCGIAVTHQKINEIKMYDNLAFCENCVRILYLPDDIEL